MRTFSWVLFFSCWLNGAGAAPLVLHLGRTEVRSELTEIAVAVLTKAYAKIDVRPSFDPYPLRRSLRLADQGGLDGEVMRAELAFADAPNLIRLAVPIVQIVPVLYLRADCPDKLTWSDLRGRRVAYERGVKILENRLSGALSVLAKSNEDVFRMLQLGMADFAAMLDVEGELTLRNIGSPKVCKVAAPLEVVPLFHALHRRHRTLAARLEQVLGAMERNGEIQAIWDVERARLLGARTP